jgi:DNA-directed RNA polymerase subunit K/omega
MIDNPGAQLAVGNIYDFVLIASERVREINRERAENGTYLGDVSKFKALEKPHLKACREIVEGKVGREYLKKIGQRIQKNRNTMR